MLELMKAPNPYDSERAVRNLPEDPCHSFQLVKTAQSFYKHGIIKGSNNERNKFTVHDEIFAIGRHPNISSLYSLFVFCL